MAFDLEAWLATSLPSPPIIQAGAAVLRRRSVEVPASLLGTRALAQLVDAMVETMRAAPGVGLAAPQLGVPLRIFVAEDTAERMAHVSPESRALRERTPLPLTVAVNPAVAPASPNEAIFFEGCLSVRGYGALVRRSTAVAVTGVSPTGSPMELLLEGWPARIMQHEMDHLDGTLYVDRMISRSLASDTELGRLAALPVSEVLRDLVEP
jgi:peptide deformylase